MQPHFEFNLAFPYAFSGRQLRNAGNAEAVSRRVTVVRGAPVAPAEMIELARAALVEAAAGRLRPVIGQTFPLENAAGAHRAIETRATVGKTLLLVDGAGGRR